MTSILSFHLKKRQNWGNLRMKTADGVSGFAKKDSLMGILKG
ncbi:MAG: hypothetical protein NWQ46_04490 [Spirosomaceae bacterium]|nr:hypothetical protein [Spirosomataceae bacterium]